MFGFIEDWFFEKVGERDFSGLLLSVPLSVVFLLFFIKFFTGGEYGGIVLFKAYFELPILFLTSLFSRFLVYRLSSGDWEINVWSLFSDSGFVFFLSIFLRFLLK